MSYEAMNHWRALEEERLRERIAKLEKSLELANLHFQEQAQRLDRYREAAQAVVDSKPDSVAHCKLAYTINALGALLGEGE